MADKIILAGNNIEGNITDCKIENQIIKVEKNSVFSLQQKRTYASYDVCTKEIIHQYVIPEFTGFALIGAFLVIVIFTIAIVAWFDR